MYEQIEKPKENKSRAVANSNAQKKNGVKQGFGFVDNRPEAVAKRALQKIVNSGSQGSQLKTIRHSDSGSVIQPMFEYMNKEYYEKGRSEVWF